MSPLRSTLDELAFKYRTDKAVHSWSAAQYVHGYTPFYERVFSARRNENVAILDIGAWGENQGGSALMWRDYFPQARVFALDYNVAVEGLRDHGITGIQCNLDDGDATIRKLTAQGVRFDIVVEDASHYPPQQMRNLLHVSPLLARGFQYVIEDIDSDGGEAMQQAVVAGRLPHLSVFEWASLSLRIARMEVVVAKSASKLLYIT